MVDKLTVGRIERLSDKPAALDLSKIEVVKRKPGESHPLDRYREGVAQGRAEAIDQVISWLGSHTIPAHPSQFGEGYRVAIVQVEELRKRWVADGKIAGRASADNT